MTTTTPAADFMRTALIASLIGDPADVRGDLAPYFNSEYVQIADGHASDFPTFVAHLQHLRSLVTDVRIEVFEALREGSLVADRHHVTVTKTDGSTSAFEVLLVGQLDERGRLLRVNETTRQLSGAATDADLGRAR